MSVNPAPELTLTVDIAAQPGTVFQFLTETESFRQWLGPESITGAWTGADLIVRYPDGHVARGKLTLVEPAKRLEFTWGYEDADSGLPVGATTVRLALEPLATGTRLQLTHAGLPTEEQRAAHALGWNYYLGCLAAVAAEAQHGPGLARLVANYIEAWNETDEAQRAAILAQCWAENGRYLDKLAAVPGREALLAHIGNAQQFSPGAMLELVGRPSHCHGAAQWDWRMTAVDAELGAGRCYGRLNADGRLTEVVSFWSA